MALRVRLLLLTMKLILVESGFYIKNAFTAIFRLHLQTRTETMKALTRIT